MTDDCLEDRYKLAKAERQKYVTAVLNSPARHKIVVAGPGTGKTYLFKEVLRGKRSPLTLSFINNLVDDLMLELCGLSDVRTLHSYARSTLQKMTAKDIRLASKLSKVIAEDALTLLSKTVDFDEIFQTRDDDNPLITFYRERKEYYGHYGYSDIVFGLVKYWERYPLKILPYSQVIVDEFQDFNQLEVSLIELLAQKSPVLLVGDDDQALYPFKHAKADYIRQRHHPSNTTYASFVLPYCSRCTRVIVDASNDIVRTASGLGYLKDRIQKPYMYFDDKDKDRHSTENPLIAYTQEVEKRIPYFIDQQIKGIAETVRGKFSVLIISPTQIKLRDIDRRLRRRGFENIDYAPRSDSQDPPGILDGLKILLEDRQNNLGWRIVSKVLLGPEVFDPLLQGIKIEDSTRIADVVDESTRKRVKELLTILRKIRDDEYTSEEQIQDICNLTDRNPHAMAKADLQREVPRDQTGKVVGRKIPIKLTTVQGSKGLAEEYVFITHFDDRYFAKDKNNITDQQICSFLVALTRAKKKVFLISSEEKDPTFLTWISGDRIQRIASTRA